MLSILIGSSAFVHRRENFNKTNTGNVNAIVHIAE